MSSTRASRLIISRAFLWQSATPTGRHCVGAARCYASSPASPKNTSKSSTAKPNPRATAAKLNSVRKKAATRKVDLEENDSLAARTPLKKPTTDGLGVPSASPSSASSNKSGWRSWLPGGSSHDASANSPLGDGVSPAAGEADLLSPKRRAEIRAQVAQEMDRTREQHKEYQNMTPEKQAEFRERRLRMARESRADKLRMEEERAEQERQQDEKRARLKSLYMRLVIGLPFVIVLSWHLWKRCKSNSGWG